MQNQQQSNQSALQQSVLERQMLQAEQLRDKEMPQSTHWLSGLVGLGNKAAGLRDVRDTKAEQKSNNASLAKAQAAMQKAEMDRQARGEQNQLAQIGMQQSNRGEDAAAATEAARLKHARAAQLAKTKHGYDLEMAEARKKPAAVGAAERYYTKDGQPFAGHVQKDGSYLATDGTVVPATDVKTFGKSGIKTGNERKMMGMMPGMLEKSYGYMDYQAEDWERVMRPLGMSVGHTTVAKFLNSTEKTGFNEFLEQAVPSKAKRFLLSDESRAALQESFSTLNDIRTNVIMPYREDNTSGALSDRDVQEFVTNIGFDENMSGEAAYEAAQRLFGKQVSYGRQRLEQYDKHGDEEAWTYAQPGMEVVKAYDERQAAQKGEEATKVEKEAATQAMMEGAPEGVTSDAVKSWLGDLREATQQELEQAARLAPNDPALQHALSLIKQKTSEMK